MFIRVLLLLGDTRNRLPFPFISIFNIAFNRFKKTNRLRNYFDYTLHYHIILYQ